jgi:ATP-binding cassette subfamily B protein
LKTKNSRRGTLLRLWGYLYQFKWLLVLAVILTIASNLFALVGPLLSGYAIDAIQIGKGRVAFEKVFYYCSLMVGFYVASAILSYGISRLMIYLSQKIAFRLRKDLFEKNRFFACRLFRSAPNGRYRQPHELRHRYDQYVTSQ